MLIDSIETIGAFVLTGEDGSSSPGADVTLIGGMGDGTNVGGSIIATGGDGGTGAGGDGGDVILTAGSAGVASAGDGGDVVLVAGAGDGAGAPGVISAVSSLVAGGGVVVPPGPFGLELVPGPKAGLPGALGAGLAGAPPGSMFVIIDDATGPTPFVLIIVDGTSTYVRTDTYAAVT